MLHHLRYLLLTWLCALLLTSPLIYAGLSVSPGTPAHTHTDANTGGGTLAVSGTVSSTKACAANFTRIGPNYCHFTGNVALAGVTWVDAVGCTVRTPAGSLPGDAKAASIALHVRYLSNNAIGQRSNDVSIANSGCAVNSQFIFFNDREAAAVAAGTSIGETTIPLIVPLTSGSFSTAQANAGGNGNADVDSMYTLGYYD